MSAPEWTNKAEFRSTLPDGSGYQTMFAKVSFGASITVSAQAHWAAPLEVIHRMSKEELRLELDDHLYGDARGALRDLERFIVHHSKDSFTAMQAQNLVTQVRDALKPREG